MMDQNEMKQLLNMIPQEDLQFVDQLLVVRLGSSELVESAALLDPASGVCEALCLSTTMGVDDIEGMENDTVEISREKNSAPLAELALPQDGGVKVTDPGDVSLVFWNRSGKTVTVEGDKVEPGDYLLVKNLFGEELDRAIQLYLKKRSAVRC